MAVVGVGEPDTLDDGQPLVVEQRLHAGHGGMETEAVIERQDARGVDGERPACRRVGGVLIGDDRVQPVVASIEGDEHQGARRAGGATRRGGGREEGVEGLGSEGGPEHARRGGTTAEAEELAAVEAPAGLGGGVEAAGWSGGMGVIPLNWSRTRVRRGRA